MDLAKHVGELLYFNDCVTIPGFGSFLLEKKDASYNESNNLYSPPTKSLSFNQKLQSNDGVLALHLSKVLGLSYEKSVIEIHKLVINWNEKLKNSKLNLSKIGELSLNDEGAILFNPKKNINYLIDSYALKPVNAELINRSDLEKTENMPVYFTVNKNNPVKLFRYAASFIAVTFFAICALYLYNEVQNDRYIQKENKLRAIAKNNAVASIYNLGELPPIKITFKKFYLIAGSFQIESNADNLVKSLKKSGFNSSRKLAITEKGFFQVSISSHVSAREAYNEMRKLKKNSINDIWVLSK
jgi:hypothetical protein